MVAATSSVHPSHMFQPVSLSESLGSEPQFPHLQDMLRTGLFTSGEWDSACQVCSNSQCFINSSESYHGHTKVYAQKASENVLLRSV